MECRDYDYVLLLDVIEHLASPETFVEQLRRALKLAPDTKLIVEHRRTSASWSTA